VPTSGLSKATLARDELWKINREVQSMGLQSNKEEDYTLTYDSGTGEIALPANTLSADPIYFEDNRYVERAGKIYDTEDHTFVISKDLHVEIVFFLPFDELPQVTRNYIMVRAARKFVKKFSGEVKLERFTSQDELEAKVAFQRQELNDADLSILDNIYINRGVLRRA